MPSNMFEHQERKQGSLQIAPHFGFVEGPADCGLLRGHQWPWFAQFFTKKLEKVVKLITANKSLIFLFASQLREKF